MNDTSIGHSGSRAVMRSLYSELADCEIIGVHKLEDTFLDYSAFYAADWIVLNGEGTIHHHAAKGDFLLSALAHAQHAGKSTALINCVYQQTTAIPELLGHLDIFTVRELCSFECAVSHGGNPKICLDSAADRKCLARGSPISGVNGVVYGETHPHAATHGILEATNRFHMASASFDDVVATLQHVDVYVTGQHHGVYAAALARCIFVPIESNSHKVSGLIKWSGLPIPVIQHPDDDLRAAIEWARDNRSVYDQFFDWFNMQDVTRLGNLTRHRWRGSR